MTPKNWSPSWLISKNDGTFAIREEQIFGGSSYILQLQKNCYIPLIQKHISGKVLDCGCGLAPYYAVYSPHSTEVTWADNTSNAGIELDFRCDLNEALPFSEGQFDSILLTDVLAHVYRQRFLFSELIRILKPGGKLLLTTPYTYWMASAPHEYGRPSEYTFRRWCDEEKVDLICLESYGGHGDVLLDGWNKKWSSGLKFRLFKVLAFLLKKIPSWKKHNEKTRYSYPLGYALVVQKRKA
jgi:SAM-dependent methyltransferase